MIMSVLQNVFNLYIVTFVTAIRQDIHRGRERMHTKEMNGTFTFMNEHAEYMKNWKTENKTTQTEQTTSKNILIIENFVNFILTLSNEKW